MADLWCFTREMTEMGGDGVEQREWKTCQTKRNISEPENFITP